MSSKLADGLLLLGTALVVVGTYMAFGLAAALILGGFVLIGFAFRLGSQQ